MRRKYLILFILLFIVIQTNAQIRTDGGGRPSQDPKDTTSMDSFSFKRYFNALGQKDTMKISHMFVGSLILPGTAQIYNQDYWKLPIIYAGIGGMIYGAHHYNARFQITKDLDQETNRNLFIAGAALIYWGSLLDGVVSYKTKQKPFPARPALYSALLPGLGQAYNGDWWKIPIFYAGMTTSIYLWQYNNSQFLRFQQLYRQAENPNGGYTGTQSSDNLKYQRDQFRRMRDYSILATVILYVLQIVDADVFATMSDFDVSDDLSLNIEPTIILPIMPLNNYNYTSTFNTSIGLQLNLNF